MRTALVAMLLALSAAALAPAADPAPPDTAAAEKLARKGIGRLKAEGVKGVLEFAFDEQTGSPPKEGVREKAEANFVKLRETVVGRYGKPIGEPQLVRTDVSGASLVRFVFLERLERAPLIWYLNFYRTAAGWRCLSLHITDIAEREFRPIKADAAGFADAAKAAQAGAAGLKASPVAGLFDRVFEEGKNVLPVERGPAETRLAKIRDDNLAALGEATGTVELVRAEAVGDALVRFVYLEKCERGALAWKFTLYRTGAGWKWRDVGLTVDLINDFPVSP